MPLYGCLRLTRRLGDLGERLKCIIFCDGRLDTFDIAREDGLCVFLAGPQLRSGGFEVIHLERWMFTLVKYGGNEGENRSTSVFIYNRDHPTRGKI